MSSLPTGMLLHGLLESAEQLINPLLKRDAAAQVRLAAMGGKSIRIRCTQPELAVMIWPSAQGLHLERDVSDADADVSVAGRSDIRVPDAEVSGPLNDFIRFLLAGDRREALLFEGALTLRGDTALIRQLQQLIAGLDADLIALFERRLGVIPSALLAAPLSALSRWRSGAGKTAMLDWQEYLQYELALLPAEAELAGYRDGVREARRSTDRLNARVERLQQQIQTLSGHLPGPQSPSEPHS